MRDATLGAFSLSNREAVGNGAWWGGEPIWVSAEKAGLPTATFSGPAAKRQSRACVRRAGSRTTKPMPVNAPRRHGARVVERRRRHPAAAGHAVSSRRSTMAGHSHGPDSDEMRDALARGRCRHRPTARRTRRSASLLENVNLIVTSDHGMATVRPGNAVAIEDMVDRDGCGGGDDGAVRRLQPAARPRAARRYARLDRRTRTLRLLAQRATSRSAGTTAAIRACRRSCARCTRAGTRCRARRSAKRPAGVTRGSHGFDPALASMRAIFIARGPSFRRGLVVPPIDNVDVYPLLASLLGLEPGTHDGNPQALASTLAR